MRRSSALSEFAARKETALRLEGGPLLKRARFSADGGRSSASPRRTRPREIGVYFQVVEAGYDAALPTEALADGLEIFRELVDEEGACRRRPRSSATRSPCGCACAA